MENGGGGFYMGAQDDWRTITDAAQNAACMIAGFDHLPVFHAERIIIP